MRKYEIKNTYPISYSPYSNMNIQNKYYCRYKLVYVGILATNLTLERIGAQKTARRFVSRTGQSANCEITLPEFHIKDEFSYVHYTHR